MISWGGCIRGARGACDSGSQVRGFEPPLGMEPTRTLCHNRPHRLIFRRPESPVRREVLATSLATRGATGELMAPSAELWACQALR